MRRVAICGAMLSLAAQPAAACRLALLLAMDVSRSVDAGDYRIQRDGLLDALADPEIRAALFDPPDPVALAIFEWSGIRSQEVIADWQVVRTPQDLAAIEAAVAARSLPQVREATALGAALDYGHGMIEEAPECTERVIDVSGDGQNNIGLPPSVYYEDEDWTGIRVNGLAIGEHEFDIADYYQTNVIRGAGAFVELAPRQADFPRAIRRKLLRELTDMMMGAAGTGPGGAG